MKTFNTGIGYSVNKILILSVREQQLLAKMNTLIQTACLTIQTAYLKNYSTGWVGSVKEGLSDLVFNETTFKPISMHKTGKTCIKI